MGRSATSEPPGGAFVPSQRLFRAEVQARGDEASLRLTLRLWSERRFDLTASDLVGRALWRLAVDGAIGRLDGGAHERRCRFDPTEPIELPRLRLPVEAESLAAILLGRLPASVASSAGEGTGAVSDARGRSWEIERAAGGELVGWRLLTDGESPELVWKRVHESSGDRLRLDCAERALVVTWRERARSALSLPPPTIEIEPELPDCRELDLS